MKYSYINRRKVENSRTCEICILNVQRASFVRHLKSKKHSENIKQYEMIIPEWLIKEQQARIKKQIKKL